MTLNDFENSDITDTLDWNIGKYYQADSNAISNGTMTTLNVASLKSDSRWSCCQFSCRENDQFKLTGL